MCQLPSALGAWWMSLPAVLGWSLKVTAAGAFREGVERLDDRGVVGAPVVDMPGEGRVFSPEAMVSGDVPASPQVLARLGVVVAAGFVPDLSEHLGAEHNTDSSQGSKVASRLASKWPDGFDTPANSWDLRTTWRP